MRQKKQSGLFVQFLAIVLGAVLSLPCWAMPVQYTIDFSGQKTVQLGSFTQTGFPLTAQGSFTYDADTSTFSDFIVQWTPSYFSTQFDFTSAANLPFNPSFSAGIPPSICGLQGPAYVFSFLTHSDCAIATGDTLVWGATAVRDLSVSLPYDVFFIGLISPDGIPLTGLRGIHSAQDSAYVEFFQGVITYHVTETGTWSIPEPGSSALVLTAISFLLLVRRRNAQSALQAHGSLAAARL